MNYRKSLSLSTCLISIFLTLFTAASAGSPLIQYDYDDEGITPLMLAVRDGEGAQLKTLLKKGADLNAKDPYGWTALIYAVTREDESAVKSLLNSNGIDVDAKDKGGSTALIHAAQQRKASIVKRLIDSGASVN